MGGYRAPLRVDLAGGWTDLAPYTHDHGGEVVNFTIDKWVTATLSVDGNVDFKFDGEMQPDVALEEVYKELYPFSEIVGNSNVLVMPSQHSAAISYKMIKSMSRAKLIGPLLIGLGLPIEIAPLRSSTSDIINLSSIAAYSADVIDYKKN